LLPICALAVVVVGVGAVVAASVGIGSGSGHRSATIAPGTVALRLGGHTVASFPVTAYISAGRPDRPALTALVRRYVPKIAGERIGAAQIAFRYDRSAAIVAVLDAGGRGGNIEVPRRPVSSSIAVAVVKQALHNDCEAAALQMVLASVGRNGGQLTLQAQMPRSGPLDPIGQGDHRVWGDPELGFVGRADGGGPAGGFGVYQRPVAQLAKRHGVPLTDLTGSPPARLYRQLLAGHTILAWVGLTAGPYDHWRSPQGKLVNVDYGEHAIALVGYTAGGALKVANPLSGQLEIWSRSQFETDWARLGHRALST
jgi:uncharacterized protein YvpB